MPKNNLRISPEIEDLLNNSSDLIIYFHYEGKVLFFNKSALEKLGYTSEILLELTWLQLVDFEKYDSWNLTIDLLKNGKKIDKIDTVFLNKYAEKIHLIGNIQLFETDNTKYVRIVLKDVTKQKNAEKLQIVYNNISNLVFKSKDLNQLYADIHFELNKILDARNFFISSYDEELNQIYFPYYVNEKFEKQDFFLTPSPLKKGLTEYILRQKHSISLNEEMIEYLIKNKEIDIIKPYPKVWMGALLKIEGKVIGTVSCISYESKNIFSIKHLSMLNFVSGQIALAIQRKKILDENKSQSARLYAIFNSSSHLMWTADKKTNLTSFNDNYSNAIFELWGKRPEINTDPNKPKIKFATDDYHNFWMKKYENAFKGISQHFETELTDKNGNKVFREMFLNPIYDDNGEIIEVSGIGHNITEKKLSEIKLKESEEKFRGIFESLIDVYYRTNEEGSIILVSPSIQTVLGYTTLEAKAIKASDLYYNPKDRLEFIKLVKENGKVVNFKTQFVKKNKEVIDVLINSKATFDENGKIIAIEGISKDITDLVKYENELKKAKELAEHSLKVKEQFLANMSHEIRTPLNGIIGMTELISDTQLDIQQKQFLENVKKSSHTLLSLVNDVLDLSKMEAGKMTIKSERIDIRNLFEKIKNAYHYQAIQKGLIFDFEIDKEVPLFIVSDEKRIIQIISNLISNSFKFTVKGFIKFKVILVKQAKKSVVLRFEISDSGIGIPADEQDKLFQSFSQIDNSFSKKYSGTGLGLVISKELVKILEGEIGFTSTQNKGSLFWFTITANIDKSTDKNEEIGDEDDFVVHHKNTDFSILVVDDNRINLDIACKLLEKAGFKVESATNGVIALEKASAKKYHLILMDIQMPEMDGITCTNLIKDKTINSSTPTIAITAYAMEDDKDRFINAGLDDYLAKPVSSSKLINKVNEWLYNSKEIKSIPAINKNKLKVHSDFFNKDIINQLKKYGGVELIQTSFEEYDTETAILFDELQKSVEQKDINSMLNILHTIKGTSFTIGIDEIGKTAAEMEQNLKSNDFETCIRKFPKLRTDYVKFKNIYKTYLKNG